MKRQWIGSLCVVLALPGPPPLAAAPLVKIHEVLGGPAGYLDLHNVGATPLQLGGWSVRSCTGGAVPVELATMPAGSEIPAGEHFLISGQAFGGADERRMIVPEIPGDGQMLLDRRGVKIDSVGWTSSSPCREKDAALACAGFAQARDFLSSDTDDNRADFGCSEERNRGARRKHTRGETVVRPDVRAARAAEDREGLVPVRSRGEAACDVRQRQRHQGGDFPLGAGKTDPRSVLAAVAQRRAGHVLR